MEQAKEHSNASESQSNSDLGGFDPRVVHERDPKTHRIARVNSHKVICYEGIRYYEWPKNSRNLWWEDRSPAGRLDDNGRPVRGAKHMAWEAPITEAQGLQETLNAKDFEIKQLAKELEMIKKEAAAKKFEQEQAKQRTTTKLKAAEAKKQLSKG